MTTLNAKANAAYHDLITEYEREHPNGVWLGFSHQRDAFEEGYEVGHTAALAEFDRERLARAIDPEVFDETVKRSSHQAAVVQWAARRHIAYKSADAVLALLNSE